jgi:hypothetical protein
MSIGKSQSPWTASKAMERFQGHGNAPLTSVRVSNSCPSLECVLAHPPRRVRTRSSPSLLRRASTTSTTSPCAPGGALNGHKIGGARRCQGGGGVHHNRAGIWHRSAESGGGGGGEDEPLAGFPRGVQWVAVRWCLRARRANNNSRRRRRRMTMCVPSPPPGVPSCWKRAPPPTSAVRAPPPGTSRTSPARAPRHRRTHTRSTSEREPMHRPRRHRHAQRAARAPSIPCSGRADIEWPCAPLCRHRAPMSARAGAGRGRRTCRSALVISGGRYIMPMECAVADSRSCSSTDEVSGRLTVRGLTAAPSPPPIDAPCTHCLRHGDPMRAQK